MTHGMVMVSTTSGVTPTCLCGWIGAAQRGAAGFGNARKSWQGHVELDERLDLVDALVRGDSE